MGTEGAELEQEGAGAAAAAGTGEEAVPAAAAAAGQPEAPIAGAEAQPKVELTELEEFRKYQSGVDRREGELRRQLEAQQARLQELEQQAQQVEEQRLLQDADPDELAAFYQRKLAEERARAQTQQQALTLQQQVMAAGQSLLARLGLSSDTPELDWGDGQPTWENYARLTESALGLVAAARGDAAKTAEEKVERAAREARQAAIKETGAARVSTATGGAPAGQNPIKDINDPDELLKLAMKGGARRR